MKKLDLKDISVHSFITEHRTLHAKTVKGGRLTSEPTWEPACETITVIYGTCNPPFGCIDTP